MNPKTIYSFYQEVTVFFFILYIYFVNFFFASCSVIVEVISLLGYVSKLSFLNALQKRTKISFYLALNYSKPLWWISIISSLRLTCSFILVYSGLFCFKFRSFSLDHNIIWRYFSLCSIWNYTYIYIHIDR